LGQISTKKYDALVERVLTCHIGIGNKKCIQIVLQRNLLKNTQGLYFSSRNLS
jgi:hypothetical protein